MARFADVLKGTRARKAATFPLPGAKASADGTWEGGTVKVDLRPLTPAELASCYAAAAEYAKARGVAAVDGEPVYDIAIRSHVIALAVLDCDEQTKAVPFFASAEEVMSADGITDAHVGYLYELCEHWQLECSPQIKTLDAKTFEKVTISAAEGDALPFLSLVPGTRWLYTRSLASLYLASLRSRSLSGQGSQDSSTTSGSDDHH